MRRKRSAYGVDVSAAGRAERTIDGVEFASKAEALRYQYLRTLERSGEIQDLSLQPQFTLQRAFRDSSGAHRQAIVYTADFRYVEAGGTVIEEVKGRESRDFSLRMRMFLFKYPEYRYKLVPSDRVLKVR